jgi:DMSO/TMAO reductase YedYZ molybdopterin-dependent catalytic subunit
MKNPKWLKRIELLASASEGFWEGQGWSNDATVQTMSRIDVPGPAPVAAGDVDIEGIAFAGDRGVQLVEISTDAGRTWRAAKLTPPLGPLTWVFWHLGVALGKGTHHAQVRATDGTGQVQTSKQSGGYAHGSTGYDEVSIRAQS